jgi:hypothetical protein
VGFAHAAGQARDELIKRFQRLFDEGAIDGVALVAADANACRVCAGLADRVYAPRKLPRLPVERCATPTGCRCRYEPSITVVE